MSSLNRDFNRALVEDLRANGGQATSGPFKGRDVLILSTKGAKSVQTRVNPLVYTRTDGGHLVIDASKGGAPTHPAWYHNLVAHPDVTVEVLGEKFNPWRASWMVTSTTAFTYTMRASTRCSTNTARTSRKIPVVVLERID